MIEVHNKVLSMELIKEVKEYVTHLSVHRSSYISWNHDIILSSAPVLIFDIDNNDLKYKLIEELKNIIDISSYKSVHIMYYYWPKLSYIPWHNDKNKSKGITIYMNEYWDSNWGGYFAYQNKNKTECIKPSYNTAVIVSTPIEHTVFSVSIEAPVRETIQVFLE